MSDEKTLTDHAQHHAGKDVTLEQLNDDVDLEPDVDEIDVEEVCGATAHLKGKVRTCSKEPEHEGQHKAGRVTWRRRSGDHR